MRVYLFGGAVRDEILGIPPRDLDYFVEGATPAEFLARTGKRGRVLAITDRVALFKERGSKHEYLFAAQMGIHELLRGADLYINGVARDVEGGGYISPFLREALADARGRVLNWNPATVRVSCLKVLYLMLKFPDFRPGEGVVAYLAARPRTRGSYEGMALATILAKLLALDRCHAFLELAARHEMEGEVFPIFASMTDAQVEAFRRELPELPDPASRLRRIAGLYAEHGQGLHDLRVYYALQDEDTRELIGCDREAVRASSS